tara:strand:+ start:159 stop:1136 length:978 start_codon:yes stop_codon:yes gene_type:complete
MSDYQYPLSTGRSNILGTEAFRDLLGQSLEKAKDEIIILSAYVKKVGVEWLIEKLSKKEINCTIISRWDKGDLAQGSSDIECYELCKINKWQFKILKDLHAKIMLVDKKDLFIGSPNLTGHGMSLIPVSNKEMGVKLEAASSDIKIIKNLNEEAILVDDQIYKELKLWKENLPEIKKIKFPDFPDSLKSKFTENLDKIWVHNFPWCSAEELFNDKKNDENFQHDLELFGLEKNNLEKEIIKKNILNSKIYYWLINQINNQEKKELYFGNLSSIIHESLLDDPRPYRQDIKTLQSNLYSYIKNFLLEKFIIDVPKERSERIRLKIN